MAESEALKFYYRGYTFDKISSMSMEDLIALFPARARRTLKRGIKQDQSPLLEKVRKIKREGKAPTKLRTHARDMVILPEMVGLTIHVHNGKEFVPVEVKPEMIGHYLGEFSLPYKRVIHGEPGLRATRSSMYVPLK